MRALPSLVALLALPLASACGPDIKGEALPDSGDTAATDGDSGGAVDTADTDDTDDTDDTAPPPTGDVVVEYTVSWVFPETTVELCAGEISMTDVDTSHRSWTLWTDAGIELDLSDLPSSAPQSAPVGDGNTVNPGSWRFSFDAETDADLPAYNTALAGGATPYCLLASGNDRVLQHVTVPDPIPGYTEPVAEVGLRISVLWTDR